MVPDLLAWQVRSERTYSLSAVPVTGGGGGGAGPRRLTIYAPGSPSETPTPPEAAARLWFCGGLGGERGALKQPGDRHQL